MFYLITGLLPVAAFSNAVALILLAVKRNTKQPANILLAIFLLGMGFALGMLYLIYTKTILNLPWLFRLGSPLYYAMFPAVYLYARMMVKDQRKLLIWDFLHFLPALLHLIELMPYYLLPLDVKVQHVKEALSNPIGGFAHDEGWLPEYYHNIIRGLLGIFYGGLVMNIGWRMKRLRPNDYMLYPKQVLWIKVLGVTTTFFGLQIFVSLQFGNADLFTKQLLGLLSISQLVSAYFLIANSEVMYGMPMTKVTKIATKSSKVVIANENIDEHQSILITKPEGKSQDAEPKKIDKRTNPAEEGPIQYAELKESLLSFMDEKKPYLQQRYTIGELARDMNIPQYHLTYLLSQVMNIRFNDFINKYRIQYLKESMAEDDFLTHTLEALAQQAGFNSRVTFIRAVQKHTGLNPSEYFQKGNND